MAIAAISSGENKFETLERMLHSPTVTVNNDVEIKLNNLSPRALRYMLTKELNIEKLVEEQKKIKLNSTLLDKIINDKTTQTKKAKFSDITGFSLRPLTDAENIKFELDTLKTYYTESPNKAEELTEYILKNREEVVKETIRRKLDKKN